MLTRCCITRAHPKGYAFGQTCDTRQQVFIPPSVYTAEGSPHKNATVQLKLKWNPGKNNYIAQERDIKASVDWKSWQVGSSQLRLPNTKPGTRHGLEFGCFRCGTKILSARDIYRLKNGTLWTYDILPTLKQGKKFYNKWKQIHGYTALCCKCNLSLGALYTERYEDADPGQNFPAAKVTILREKSGCVNGTLMNSLVLLADSRHHAEMAIKQLTLDEDDDEIASNFGIRVTSRTFELLKQQKEDRLGMLQMQRALAAANLTASTQALMLKQKEDNLLKKVEDCQSKILEMEQSLSKSSTDKPECIRECEICYTDSNEYTGIRCGGPDRHFFCRSCFASYVEENSACSTGAELEQLRNCKAEVLCPADCGHQFSACAIARCVGERVFAKYTKARRKLMEVLMDETAQDRIRHEVDEAKEKIQAEILRKVKADEELRLKLAVEKRKRHVEEKLMNLACPRCSQVFVDYTGCAALVCGNSRCGCRFCAFCLKDCGRDAHGHVATCRHRPKDMRDTYFTREGQFDTLQRERRQRLIVEYFQTVPEKERSHLYKALRTQFRDCRLRFPAGWVGSLESGKDHAVTRRRQEEVDAQIARQLYRELNGARHAVF